MVPFCYLFFLAVCAMAKNRLKDIRNSFLSLLPNAFRSAVVLAAFPCATAASSNIRGTSGLQIFRLVCKLEWVCDEVLSKSKPK